MQSFAWIDMTLTLRNHAGSLRRWQRVRSRLLILGMLLALGVIAGLSSWDVHRRSAQSMEDFGRHQEQLARSIAANLESQLVAQNSSPQRSWSAAMQSLQKLEQPGTLQVLVWRPGSSGFITLQGGSTAPGLLQEAVLQRRGYVRLHRDFAAQLGLPKRAAMVGLSQVRTHDSHTAWVAVVATAMRARDREEEASWRVLLSVFVAAGAVLGLGGLALHWQRQELRSQQALAVEEERREREAALTRSNRAATLGTLAMGITHELSTPLSIIIARADQLRNRLGGDERSLRSLQVIGEQASRMGQIIVGILALVRNQPPSTNRLSAASLCQGAMALVAHRFAETQTALGLEAKEDLSGLLLRGEQRLLEQALVNLLLNACDACPANGQVILQVVQRAQEICFRVTDNGIGISADAAARATEPFFTTKAIGKGTGLGLAVTQEIVKSHRGRLCIAALPQGGTCAEIVLPKAEEYAENVD